MAAAARGRQQCRRTGGGDPTGGVIPCVGQHEHTPATSLLGRGVRRSRHLPRCGATVLPSCCAARRKARAPIGALDLVRVRANVVAAGADLHCVSLLLVGGPQTALAEVLMRLPGTSTLEHFLTTHHASARRAQPSASSDATNRSWEPSIDDMFCPGNLPRSATQSEHAFTRIPSTVHRAGSVEMWPEEEPEEARLLTKIVQFPGHTH